MHLGVRIYGSICLYSVPPTNTTDRVALFFRLAAEFGPGLRPWTHSVRPLCVRRDHMTTCTSSGSVAVVMATRQVREQCPDDDDDRMRFHDSRSGNIT